ncbi:uncharacterized protein LOC8270629 [Ricinus communis]|uniref:Uncharacterized protein n=1 Tax=Ricinus communis TaxID=3988 RepID=B9RDC2_RICCO|nr:uncharacterized protein LOC8270629 [Ricinus communis]EEF50380.1 conserved hypothetical protein [Ricinus communis]|eukprot:XP_002511711.1 uncharacterized protein LOC8270629 [Ricinus communis]
MASWSPENATKAYLRALKMGKRSKQPDIAEFISALAAGNNARLMVMASAGVAGSTGLSLVAAAHQTGGQAVCILSAESDLYESRNALGTYADCVKFVIGDAKTLLSNDYKEADFVLIDCKIDGCKEVLRAAQECEKHGRGLIVGYNAFHKGSWPSAFKTHFLPIGEGLMVTRIGSKVSEEGGHRKRSKWVTRVDRCTGEEHVYRVTSPLEEIEAWS